MGVHCCDTSGKLPNGGFSLLWNGTPNFTRASEVVPRGGQALHSSAAGPLLKCTRRPEGQRGLNEPVKLRANRVLPLFSGPRHSPALQRLSPPPHRPLMLTFLFLRKGAGKLPKSERSRHSAGGQAPLPPVLARVKSPHDERPRCSRPPLPNSR